MKVALVYDRVNKWGGAERVLLALHEMFPTAPLYTSVYLQKKAAWANVFPKVVPSFLQHIPFAHSNHEMLPYLMPLAFESFNFSNYDLVISVTSEAAKGIITQPSTKHICYCLTPTRYLWSGYGDYFTNSLIRIASAPIVKYLKKWDVIAASRPDTYIAISTEVSSRIEKYYGRKSSVVFPPTMLPIKHDRKKGSYYLLVSRMVSYKKVDLAIHAFNKLKQPLVIVGIGKQEDNLKRMANGTITFLESIPDEELSKYYASAKALIMPQHEDFGLVAVEAQMHGTPVIAYARGGALDIVKDGQTGLLFNEQTVDSLMHAVKEFEKKSWDADTIRKQADRFAVDHFKKEFMHIIQTKL